jgi:hypothetical protein
MLTQLPVWLPTLAVLCLSGFIAILLSHLLRSKSASMAPIQPRRPLDLRPMERLLREDDFAFLSQQPGYRPEVGAALRARRIEVFKGYLSQVEAEFNRLHLALRLMSLTSGQDRPDLARLLLRQRIQFSLHMFEVRVRLALFGFGIRPVSTAGIVRTMETLREQIAALQPNTIGATSAA